MTEWMMGLSNLNELPGVGIKPKGTCKWCGNKLGRDRLKFCSVLCSRQWHNKIRPTTRDGRQSLVIKAPPTGK